MEHMPETYMSVLDAVSIFKKSINKNDKPYITLMKKRNNQQIDDAKRDVFDRKSAMTGGRLQASTVWPLLDVYLKGIHTLDFSKHMSNIPRMTEEQVAYWVSFFEKPIEEIIVSERLTIIIGWNVLQAENELRLTDERLKIYSKSEDPLDWHNEMFKSRVYQKENIFWPNKQEFLNVQEKVRAVIENPIKIGV